MNDSVRFRNFSAVLGHRNATNIYQFLIHRMYTYVLFTSINFRTAIAIIMNVVSKYSKVAMRYEFTAQIRGKLLSQRSYLDIGARYEKKIAKLLTVLCLIINYVLHVKTTLLKALKLNQLYPTISLNIPYLHSVICHYKVAAHLILTHVSKVNICKLSILNVLTITEYTNQIIYY